MNRHIALLLLTALVGVGCSNTIDPITPIGNQIVMTRMADMPLVGGEATSVAFIDDSRLVAVINGRLYTIPTSGGTPSLVHSDAEYVSVVVAPTGEVFALTTHDLRIINHIGGPVTIAPLQVSGANIERSVLTMSPMGEPYVLLYSYPNKFEAWRSIDNGATWKSLPTPPEFAFGGGITWGYAGEIMLSSAAGFYTSVTRGSKWTPHAAAIPNAAADVFCAENGHIYAYQTGRAGLYVSKDGGTTFTQIQSPDKAPYFVEILDGADKALYALANRSSAGPSPVARPMSLLRSTDGGVTWQHAFYTQAFDLAIRDNMIAIGQGASSSGVCVSRNMGTTWTSSGLSKVVRIDDIGFDKDGNILILSDKALYRRAGTLWQSLGSQAAFGRMTTAPLGRMYVGQGTTMYSSFDHGASWSERVLTDYVSPGVGTIVQPAVLGMENGDFLISVTTYRDDIHPQTHTAGALYTMSDDGIPRRLPNAQGNFVTLVQDNDGDVHATTVNFNNALISIDRGATWKTVPTASPARAVNSVNRYVAIGPNNTYRIGEVGTEHSTEIAFLNFTSQSSLITSMKFDANDRLYVVTSDRGIFYSETPLK